MESDYQMGELNNNCVSYGFIFRAGLFFLVLFFLILTGSSRIWAESTSPLPFEGEIKLQPVYVYSSVQRLTSSGDYDLAQKTYKEQLSCARMIFSQIGINITSGEMGKYEYTDGIIDRIVDEDDFIKILNEWESWYHEAGVIPVFITKNFVDSIGEELNLGMTIPPLGCTSEVKYPGIIIDIPINSYRNYTRDTLAHEIGHFLLNKSEFLGGIGKDREHLSENDMLMCSGSGSGVNLRTKISSLRQVAPFGNLAKIDFRMMHNGKNQVEAMYSLTEYVTKLRENKTEKLIALGPFLIPIGTNENGEELYDMGLAESRFEVNWSGPPTTGEIYEQISGGVSSEPSIVASFNVSGWARQTSSSVEFLVDIMFDSPYEYNPYQDYTSLESFEEGYTAYFGFTGILFNNVSLPESEWLPPTDWAAKAYEITATCPPTFTEKQLSIDTAADDWMAIISNADVQSTDRIQFYYQVPLACPVGDVDRDYDVDGSDLVLFIQQFAAGGDWMSIEDFTEQFGI